MTEPKAPRVSILMSVWNAERFVAGAIESILDQTFTDFEFLIVDDGSTDGTAARVQPFADRDPRIRFVRRENRGLTVTLNELIGMARGVYFARMDADDIARPERFARQVAHLDAHPEIGIVGCSVRFIDDAGRPVMEKQALTGHERIDASNLAGRTAIAHPAAMMRRDAIEEAGGYDPAFVATQDLDLFLRVAERWRLDNVPEVLLDYRFAETSVSAAKADLQSELRAKACGAARTRRGLPPEELAPHSWRPVGDRAARRDFALGWAWDAWRSGYQATARHYFLKALRLDPFSAAAWKGVVFGNLRRPS